MKMSLNICLKTLVCSGMVQNLAVSSIFSFPPQMLLVSMFVVFKKCAISENALKCWVLIVGALPISQKA